MKWINDGVKLFNIKIYHITKKKNIKTEIKKQLMNAIGGDIEKQDKDNIKWKAFYRLMKENTNVKKFNKTQNN